MEESKINMKMKNITLRSYLHITTRKRDTNGKIINNALTRDLKIKEDDFLTVSINLLDEKHVNVENNNNDLSKKVRTSQFDRMMHESCDWEEYLLI